MELLTLTDSKLTALHHDVTLEVARRTKVAVNGCDTATILYGHEMAKRALVVAAAGKHSILFVGPPNCGKTMLRAIALALGLDQTFEARSCACGYRNDPQIACRCTVSQLDRQRRRLPFADIHIEVPRPTQREMSRPGTKLAAMTALIADRSGYTSLALDEHATNLLNASIAQLGLDLPARERIIAVARTIANLDRRERITPVHLSEAINYRMFRP